MTESNQCPAIEKSQESAKELLADAQKKIKDGTLSKQNLIWLELTGCSGNIISLLDGEDPGFFYLLTSMTNFIYNNTLMSAQGENAMELFYGALEGDFILAVEGAVSTRDGGLYTVIGEYEGEPVTALRAVREAGEKASNVIAVGACASHGGVSAAAPNPARCMPVKDALSRKVINLPGCPCHPDWFLGTLAHLLMYGEPELDDMNRPVLFYGDTIHSHCERRSYFDNGEFAQKLGDPQCMFKLGCRGPVTRADCPVRKWNGYVNWPVGADATCIGCAQFGFPDAMEPFVSFDTYRGENDA